MRTARKFTMRHYNHTIADSTLPLAGAKTLPQVLGLAWSAMGRPRLWLGVGLVLVLALAMFPTHAVDSPSGILTDADAANATDVRAVKPKAGNEPITYMHYVPPVSLGLSAGGPSVGSNWRTDTLMYGAALQSLRLGFDDCTSPAIATWDDADYVLNAEAPRDPILFTDSQTGRTIVSYMTGTRSLLAFSDNDGWSWNRGGGGGSTSSVDHHTLGGGVFHDPLTRDPNGSLYPNAVYYCSQNSTDASCARSDDGGLTFGRAVPIEASADCGGVRGHLKVAPDGTVYFPSRSCGKGQQAVVVSEDNGDTWAVRTIPGSTPADPSSDSSIGIATDGTIYFGYADLDGHPRVAVSHDKGLEWTTTGDVGIAFGIKHTAFPAMVAGDPDRAALAFLGSSTGRNGSGADASFKVRWHLYIAHTYDGGLTWTTINATPNDPVQSDSITDATIDRVGRVIVGYAGGCGLGCIDDRPNSRTMLATVARQVNGKRMFVQYDQVDVPSAPLAAGSVDPSNSSVVHLSWSTPDDHGSAITGYRIERRTASGSHSLRAEARLQNAYDDEIDPAQDYVYTITAINAVGEGPSCVPLGTRSLVRSNILPSAAMTVPADAVAPDADLDGSTHPADTTAPTVRSTVATNAATGFAIDSKIAVTFSETMNRRTITNATFTLTRGRRDVGGKVSYEGVTAIFEPRGNLAANTVYTGRIKRAAKDVAGNQLAGDFVWSFTTGTNRDKTRPTVVSTVPVNGATGVSMSQRVTATFSEAMDPRTIDKNFVLDQGNSHVRGTVTYADGTATFAPAGKLAPNTVYTARIKPGVKDLAGNPLANNVVWSFTTGATSDTTRPTVSFTVPANAATGVAINQAITSAFSEAMNPATISTSTFALKQGATAVAGTVTYAGVTATFTPASALAPLTVYTATITTGAKDLAGNALASNFVWSFTTGATPDTTRPTVSSTVPVNAATGVAINHTITAAFSEAMNPLTISTSTFTLKQGATAVAGTVSYAGVTATFTPASTLTSLTVYTATITTGAKDLAGNALAANFAWSFTTGATPDTTRPTVISTVPASGATAVAINQSINATFSEAMDPLTITTASLTLAGPGGASVTGTVGYDVPSKIATLNPTSDLAANAVYTATITTGVKDLAGNALASALIWSFTTAATAGGQAPVALGSAGTFAVLAGSTVTNTGATTVNGDLGLSPGTAVTGFPPGIVNGTIHAGDPAAAQAQLALTTAYNDAAGRTVGAIALAGNLGGQTLTPGLYKSTSSLEISSGDLTLDAQGDVNAVFIFQMASTLTTTSARQVILSGGAQAANIFWQVGSSATLGTTSVFKGNILAMASITVTTGAAVEGRLLARTAAVTLDTNVVGLSIPADTTAPTVSSTAPANAATGVSTAGSIAATFSEAMNPATISTSTFALKQGATAVAGTVTYAGVTATFTPASALAPLTVYTATITTGAKDLAGNALASNFVWSFTTGATPDTTRPTVSSTVPVNAATGVAINHTITAAFSEAMNPLTIGTATFTLKQGATAVAGTVSYAGVTATFAPASTLTSLTVYTATITTGAKDLAGNALAANFAWSFTTGATPDTTRPTVISTVPASGATAVAINQSINATFSEAMDPLTITTASLTLTGPGGASVTGTVGYDVPSKIATLNPTSDLAANAVYTATITTGVKDLAGNALASALVWSFTTAATAGGQAPVALGSAGTFAVLAGSTVTNTGATTVNGDLGLSPGTAVTGFPPGIVNGTIHAGDPAAAQAQLALTTAYNDAAGRTVGAIALAGNLGGQTLTPGLYKSTSSLEISSGDLTLDAQGDVNAVFIFQMASTLTTTSARQVILSGGAQAANIFWQVGSSATLGTTSVFKGNILAMASITVTTGATVEGRLLARTAAVTLDSNVVGLSVPADTTAPTVSSIAPANAATGVSTAGSIAATFSEAMNPATISTSTFALKQGATAVAGTVTYAGVTATFAPASALAPLTVYTATITTGAKDLAGNALASNFVWSFTTGATPDTTRPTVSSTVPVNAATGVAINHTITAAFSEAMNPLTISTSTFTLKQGATAVAGTVSYAGVTATFTPASTLTSLTVYTATITTGAKDLAGNALAANFAWSFTTGATPDTTRPTVISTVPASGATAVAINQSINATFSEAMDPLTITTASLTLAGPGGASVTGTVGYDVPSKIATLNPTSDLAANAVYTATITTGVKDLAGNALASALVWSFTTAATAGGQAPVALGSAGTFAVLAGSTVTNTGATTVNGDLGLSPGTAVTGFPPGIVNGTIHAGDPAAAQAQLALTTAYNDAAGRTVGAIALAGNLGGQTLTPGLYKSTSSLEISSGDLTLDAQGDVNAVFIFQMASTLTTTSARQVILSGGAQAANIFWQVGSSATLGTTSVFKGNILAMASITVTTGATVEGRLLARTAAVTLDSNVVGLSVPADTTAPTVSSIAPANAATGVSTAGSIAATFSEAMNPATISTSTFALKQGATAVAGTVTYAGVTATFTPASALAPLTVYTATITTGAKDLAGNALASNFVWSFTTGATPDTTRPTVSSTVPASGATAVAINQSINATFSEAMDPLTITTASLTLAGPGGASVTGTVGYDVPSKIATLNPTSDLAANAVYTATITTGVKDLAGNALASALVWSFTTAATAGGQAPVALGSAGTFAVLAGSTVTNTGATTVNGDLGLSPGTAVTGFPPGIVNGTIHAGDPAAAQAQLALTTAYNDAAGRTVGAIALAGNLGGQTLTPGLYKSTSSLEISSGDLTLDAQGDVNAVFIFQMASTLTTTSARQVILSGGAQAANIFWQVGSSATLGTTSVFKGNILAMASITVTTGAAVEGRLLARTAAVTLDTNVVGLSIPPDTTAPTVSSTAPANAATGVAINQAITSAFSEAMDPATISPSAFTLYQGATTVAGTVTYAGVTATFTPVANLVPLAVYTATITTGAMDLAGNALASDFVWSFTTASTPAGQAPVALGSAAAYAILAGSTITNTGASTVNGDLGLSPGTAVTGFPPGIVNGTIHAGDPGAAQAQLDLTTAYNDAAGRTVGAITLAGNLGGRTLAPGLYKSSSSLEISSGDLTLDAQGDVNAVFIFQMASTLTTTSARQVILSGGAQAANIFWQVGSSATLGTTSVFKGNILAMASITVTTGAAVEGRLLARTAAVSVDSNVVGF